MTCSWKKEERGEGEEEESPRESPKDKGDFLKTSCCPFITTHGKTEKKESSISLEAPVCAFATSGDWLLPARGKLCKLFSFAQRSSHTN